MGKGRRRSLRGHLLGVQAAVLLPLLVIGLTAWQVRRVTDAADERVSAGVELTQAVSALQASLGEAQTSLTDSRVIGGDPKALADLEVLTSGIDADFERLLASVEGDLAAPVLTARDDWTDAVDELHERAASGWLTADYAAMSSSLRLIQWRVVRVNQQLSAFAGAVLAQLRGDLEAAEQQVWRQTRWGLLGVLVAGLVTVAGTGRLLHARLGDPIRQLQRGVERLGAGDLGHRLPLPSLCELRGVTVAFNAMADQLQRSRDDIARSEARFRGLVQNASDLIVVIDRAGTLRYLTPSVERMLGYRPEDALGQPLEALLHPDDRKHLTALLLAPGRFADSGRPIEVRVRHADGSWKRVEALASDLLDDPEVAGIVLTSRDVTERVALQEALAHQAFHDALTGLANRALFTDRLAHALSRRQGTVAVVFLDLDDFKVVNDSLGHAAGDQLLVEVASRLQQALRPSDTPARWGGDEFAVLLEDVDDEHSARQVAQRLRRALRQPLDLDGTVVYPQASVGVAVSTGEPTTAGELLRRADTAMYAAKSEGKDTVTVFRPRLDDAQRGRLQLRADLQAALDRDEFELHYQPTVDLVTGTLTGVEALLRWRHPRRGLVAPSAFLPLAEDSGLIVPVGRWVLAEACRQAAVWQRQHPERVTTVSVNLSGRQVAVPEVVDHVRDALADSGLEPGRLVLEITESVLLEQTPALAERLAELKALGVRLAVDDFGTGYSSLAYLQRLPVDVLKIDKTFVEALGDGVEQEALAETIVTLARMMRLQAVAEGVERQEQASVLRDLGCDLAQGHLFAAPQQAAAIGDLLGAADGVGPADGVGLSA